MPQRAIPRKKRAAPSLDVAGTQLDPHQFRLMFERMQNGFALHRIIVDDAGRPVDYEFIAVNPAYTAITGLRPEKAIGRRVSELLPDTPNDPARWIERFGEVALTGREIRLEALSEALGKWFEVVAYRPGRMQFAVLIHEITDRKNLEFALLEATRRAQENIARELHDGIGQELTGIRLIADSMARAVRTGHPVTEADASHLARTCAHALEACRDLARGISPLNEFHSNLRDGLKALSHRHSVPDGPRIRFASRNADQIVLSAESADHLYRIAQEGLSNAVRHSKAKTIDIQLRATARSVTLELRDDGRGFAVRPGDEGIGFKTMRYRASLLGGALWVESQLRRGTVVRCECPNQGDVAHGGVSTSFRGAANRR